MEFTLGLVNKVSAPAADAARQMSILEKAANATRNALTKSDALGNVQKHKALTNQLKALDAAQSVIPPHLLAEVAAHKKLTAAIAEQAKAQKTADKASAKSASSAPSGGGGGGLGGQAELAEMTGGLSVVAEAAAAAAVAIGVVVVAGMALAIEASEAKQRLVSLFDALGEGKVSGAETVAMMDKLGDSIGMTRAQLTPIVQTFMTLGITGKEQLEGLSLAAARAGAMATGGAENFAKLFGQVNAAAETGSKLTIPFRKLEKQLLGVGLNIGDMATQMGISEAALTKGLKAGTVDAKKFGDALSTAASTKGAGALAQQGASLTNVWAKFQENIMRMFEDIDVGPFLLQVKSLFDIFGKGKASGQALSAGIGGFFKQVFAYATKVVPYIKRFLLDVVIYGLKAYIALKPIIKWLKEMAANEKVIKIFKQALTALGISALVVAGVIGVIVVVATAMAWIMGALAVGIVLLSVKIYELVVGAGAAMVKWVSSAASLASDFVSGLVSGITNGASAVVNAVKGLANGAKNAFKGALGIASPSKEMAKLGKFAGEGVAVGLDASTSTVSSAAGDLGGSTLGATAGGASGGGKSGGGVTVNIASGAIVIQGAGKGAEDLTEQAISLMFERIALSQGLG